MKPIIRVEKLGKQYRLGARQASYATFRETLIETVRAPFKRLQRNGYSAVETVWALKDISFEIMPGEVVGVIGRNGAGKSTLLKILTRVTEPTTGCAQLYGRVGSLLEVGTGFHPELTGRENIYLNGAVLGMGRREIERKFGEIIAFAEVEKFLDTPVKHYSSGMYMRLAFAVAAHLEPEILLVDEVLAVGDAAFQKKCLGKMGDVAKEGRTVLFVSHNMTAVKSLCHKAIYLDQGLIVENGKVESVVSAYLQKGALSITKRIWDNLATAPGDHLVRLQRANLTPMNQSVIEPITVRTPLQLEFEVWNHVPDAVLNFSVVLYNLEGICIFNAGSQAQSFPAGTVSGSFTIPGDFLNDGIYTVRLLIVKDASVALLDIHELLMFEVQDVERSGNWHGKWIGAVRPIFDWDLKVVSPQQVS